MYVMGVCDPANRPNGGRAAFPSIHRFLLILDREALPQPRGCARAHFWKIILGPADACYALKSMASVIAATAASVRMNLVPASAPIDPAPVKTGAR